MERTIFVAFKGKKNKIVEMTVQEAWDRFGSRVSESSYKIETKITYDVQIIRFDQNRIGNIAETFLSNATRSFERKELLEEIEDFIDDFRINIEDYIDDISESPLQIKITPLKWFAMFESFQGWISKHHPITELFLTKEEAEAAALPSFEGMLFSYENEIIIDEKGKIYQIGFFTNQEDAEGFLNFIK